MAAVQTEIIKLATILKAAQEQGLLKVVHRCSLPKG